MWGNPCREQQSEVTPVNQHHVINLSPGLEMLNVTKPLKTGLFFTAFIRLELDKQEL